MGTNSSQGSALSLRINGDCISTDPSTVYQMVPINLPGTESYVLSGWVKADAVSDDPVNTVAAEQDQNKQCGLRAIVYYTDDSVSEEYYYVPFDADIKNKWQFVSMPIVPKQTDKTVESIQVICAYEKNANTAYFDDLSLVREMAQTMKYDSEGNLTSVTATDLDTETYSYDGNNNLIKMVTGGNGTFNYTYDETYKHRLTSVTNGKITQSMTYDGVGNTTSSKLTNSTDDKYIETSAVYAADGNRALSVTDAAGTATSYDYGSGNTVMWNLPVAVTDANGTVTTSEYDEIGRVEKTGIASTAYLWYSYNKGLLSQVRRDTNVTQYYNLAYDDFGNMTCVKVGSKNLASYEYDSRNRLTKQTYGNGQAVTFTYDAYDRIETAAYPDGRKVTYSYNGDGAVHSVVETGGDSPAAYVYEYDSLGRLITSEKLAKQFELGSSLMYSTQDYDASNRLILETWKYPMDLTFTNRYAYNLENGTLSAMDVGNDHISFGYDSLLRLSSENVGIRSRSYEYRELGGGKTTNQVTKLSYPTLKSGYHFLYSYDSMGNIASYELSCDGGASYCEAPFTYTYDNQGQLIQATDGTNTYSFYNDGAGNILSATKNGTTHTYTYGDANWKDLLTAYDGQSITYDGAGNPTSYYNGTRWSFTWGNGRRLETASNGTDTISYNYTADGIRTSKTVNGVVHTYYYSGGLLRRETYGDTTLDFFYDANGTPFSMLQNRTNWYYYITNLQGDVIRLVDYLGNTAAYYEYDPHGNAIKASGSHCNINPLRYRGYYYDSETGFYYVSSRYYDPEIGRWINADDTAYLGADGTPLSYNLFAYCVNNPVNRTDINGNWSGWATAGVIVGAVLCIAAVTVLTCGVGTATLAGAVAVGAAKGALVGAAVGTAAGAGIGYAATGTLEGAATGAAIGFGAGAVVGAVAGGASGSSNYLKASSFLKSNGVDPSDVLSTYKGTPKVKTLKTDTTVYRTWGGSSGKYGHWVSPKNYGSNARSMLSLPDGNTCENVSSFLLREGTTILSGKAAPLFGQAGGGIQWWVGHLS